LNTIVITTEQFTIDRGLCAEVIAAACLHGLAIGLDHGLHNRFERTDGFDADVAESGRNHSVLLHYDRPPRLNDQ